MSKTRTQKLTVGELTKCLPQCNICFTYIIDTTHICSTCSATTCSYCVNQWNHTKNHCPSCREPYKGNYSTTNSNRQLAVLLGLGKKCTNRNCSKILLPEYFDDHVRRCLHRQIRCSKWCNHGFETCRSIVTIRNFVSHLTKHGIKVHSESDVFTININNDTKTHSDTEINKCRYNIVHTTLFKLIDDCEDSDDDDSPDEVQYVLLNLLRQQNTENKNLFLGFCSVLNRSFGPQKQNLRISIKSSDSPESRVRIHKKLNHISDGLSMIMLGPELRELAGGGDTFHISLIITDI